MAKNESGRRGRRPLTPLESARGAAARAKKKHEEVRKEYDLRLGVGEAIPESEQKAKRQVAQQRYVKFVELERINDDVLAAQRGEKDLPDEELSALKEARSALFKEIGEMPELGLTWEEWDELPSSMKARRLGKPKLSLDQRLIRAEKADQEAEASLRKEEERSGVKPASVEDLKERYVSKSGKGPGRRGYTRLDKIDADIRRVSRKLADVEAEQKAPSSVEGEPQPQGRRRRTPEEKRADYKQQIDALMDKAEAIEASLERDAMMRRNLKKLGEEVKLLKVSASASPNPEKFATRITGLTELRDELKEVIQEVDRIEKRLKRLSKLKPNPSRKKEAKALEAEKTILQEQYSRSQAEVTEALLQRLEEQREEKNRRDESVYDRLRAAAEAARQPDPGVDPGLAASWRRDLDGQRG